MEKSLFSREYRVFLDLLKQARKSAGLSQAQLAERLNETQSWVSKCERGERRIDLVEARYFCDAIGISFREFAQRFDDELARPP